MRIDIPDKTIVTICIGLMLGIVLIGLGHTIVDARNYTSIFEVYYGGVGIGFIVAFFTWIGRNFWE